MSERLNCTLTWEVTGDQGFCAKTVQEWGNMDYASMQLVQSTITKAIIGLGDAKVASMPAS